MNLKKLLLLLNNGKNPHLAETVRLLDQFQVFLQLGDDIPGIDCQGFFSGGQSRIGRIYLPFGGQPGKGFDSF